MSGENVVFLQGRPTVQEEFVSGVSTIKPGHLVKVKSDGLLYPHDVAGGKAPVMIANIERLVGNGYDSLSGREPWAAYATSDVVPVIIPSPGDKIQVRLPAYAAAVAIGDRLMSHGDGCFEKAPDNGSRLYSNTAASAPITNVATITAFDKSYTVPANFLQVGDILRVRAEVTASATNSTDTLTLTLKIGSTTIVASPAVDVANGDVGLIDATLQIRTIGASGTFVAAGVVGLGVPGTATMRPFALGSTAIDTTATQAITVSATWSAASTGDVCALQMLTVQLERGELAALVVAAEAVDNSSGTSEALIPVRVL